MQLAWIETFLTVVERGGFSAAASSLFRSQSRVSAHVASLERALGAPLLDRRQRPVSLTAAGHAFFEHAAAAQVNLEAGAAAARAAASRGAERVALGVYPDANAAFAPSLLAVLAQTLPKPTVEIVEHPVAMLDAMLLDGGVAMAIRPRLPEIRWPALKREPLWRERMVVVVPRGHRFAARTELTLEELAGESLVTSTESQTMAKEAGVELNLAFVSEHPQTLVALVSRGLEVIGLTNRLALETVHTHSLVMVAIARPVQRLVDVCWHGDLAGAPSAQALLEVIRRTPLPAGASRPPRPTDRALRLLPRDPPAPPRGDAADRHAGDAAAVVL